MDPITSIMASMLISGAAAPDGHGCAETPHYADVPCACTVVVDFYVPSTGGGGYTPPGGWPPAINVPAGPAIHVASPGMRVIGRPINVAGPVIHIDGPPVYVDAPPVRIAPAQIYVQRPDVHVRPSEIMVEPPEVFFSDCADGTVCTPIDDHSGVRVLSSRTTPPPALEAGPPPSYETTPPPVREDVVRPSYEAPLPPVLEAGTPPARVSPTAPPLVPYYPPKQDRN